jgi:hypothetical protein
MVLVSRYSSNIEHFMNYHLSVFRRCPQENSIFNAIVQSSRRRQIIQKSSDISTNIGLNKKRNFRITIAIEMVNLNEHLRNVRYMIYNNFLTRYWCRILIMDIGSENKK